MPEPVQIIRDTATQELQRISDALSPSRRRPLMLNLGTSATRIYRDHFALRDADSPNKKGWPRQNFWGGIAQRTNLDETRTTAAQAVVAINNRAINAKVYGGVIRPRPGKKMLAIPLRPEVYGQRPGGPHGRAQGMRLIRSHSHLYLGQREGKEFIAYWRLVPSVTVKRDPRALPPAPVVRDAVVARARAFLGRNFMRR